MKRVLIATPCLDQKVDAYFVHSLCESIKLGIKHGLDIKCIFLANESVLPMARNELLNLAHLDKYDYTVFIDDDEHWQPEYLIEIINSPKDVVCLPVVNKSDKKLAFNVLNDLTKLVIDQEDGYYQTTKIGTGFMKLSKRVVADLWASNTELSFRGKKLKNICEYTFMNGDFVGEDITLCNKIIELGYKIWINPKHTVAHIGNKMYTGDFQKSTQLDD